MREERGVVLSLASQAMQPDQCAPVLVVAESDGAVQLVAQGLHVLIEHGYMISMTT